MYRHIYNKSYFKVGKVHPNRKQIRDLEKEEERKAKETKEKENNRKRLEKELQEANEDYSEETIERYSY